MLLGRAHAHLVTDQLRAVGVAIQVSVALSGRCVLGVREAFWPLVLASFSLVVCACLHRSHLLFVHVCILLTCIGLSVLNVRSLCLHACIVLTRCSCMQVCIAVLCSLCVHGRPIMRGVLRQPLVSLATSVGGLSVGDPLRGGRPLPAGGASAAMAW